MIFTNWSLSCALLFGIIGSHLFLWIWNCDKTLTSFKNTLTEEQKTSFKTVYRIRLGISITSFILAGLVTAYIYYRTSKSSSSSSTSTSTSSSFISFSSVMDQSGPSAPCWKSECKWLFMWFGLYIVFYMICPKFKYMMTSITTKEQAHAWFKVYRCMQSRFIWGFLLGMVFYTFIVMLIRKKKMTTQMTGKGKERQWRMEGKGQGGSGLSWFDIQGETLDARDAHSSKKRV
jgi:hypothetical protein